MSPFDRIIDDPSRPDEPGESAWGLNFVTVFRPIPAPEKIRRHSRKVQGPAVTEMFCVKVPPLPSAVLSCKDAAPAGETTGVTVN